jgi:hypothetical protein
VYALDLRGVEIFSQLVDYPLPAVELFFCLVFSSLGLEFEAIEIRLELLYFDD